MGLAARTFSGLRMSGVFRPAGGALLGVGVGRPNKCPRQGRSSVWNPTARGGVAEPQNLVILVFMYFWWSFFGFGSGLQACDVCSK